MKNWFLAPFAGVAVGDFWVLKPKETATRYVYYLLQTNPFMEIVNKSTGTRMPRADWSTVSSSEFYFPVNESEQQKIGAFFKNLDDQIALHQRE